MDNNELNNNTNTQPNIGGEILMGDAPVTNINANMQPQNNLNLNQGIGTVIQNNINQAQPQPEPQPQIDTIFSDVGQPQPEPIQQPQMQPLEQPQPVQEPLIPETPKEKKGKGPIIIILLLLIVLGLAGYIAYDKFMPKTTTTNTTDTDTTKKQTNTKPLLEDTSKEVVYTYFDNKIGEYTYQIPQININSNDAKTMNKEIIDKYDKIYNDAKASGNPDSRVGYKYYVNGNNVSLLIYEALNISDIVNYSTYNINQMTGVAVKNTDLLKIKNISEKDFATKLVNSFKTADPIDNWKSSPDGQTDFDKQQYQKNIDNLTNGSIDSYSMYLGANNGLNIIFKRYGIAGSEYYEYILNMDKNVYTATTSHEIDK